MRGVGRIARIAAAEVLYRTGLTGLALRWVARIDPTSRVVILAYHNVVGERAGDASEGLHAGRFDDHVRVLSRLFTPVRAQAAAEALERGASGDRPRILFTFDDGYENHLRLAAPILHRHGVPGLVLLSTALVGTDAFVWTDLVRELLLASPLDRLVLDLDGAPETLPLGTRAERLAAAARVKAVLKGLRAGELAPRLSELAARAQVIRPAHGEKTRLIAWDGVRRLAELGWGIGSHSSRHFILARVPTDELAADLADSQHRIEAETGRHTRWFAYPNGKTGDFDTRAVEAARAAGFDRALTMDRRIASAHDDPMAIPRIAAPDEPGSAVALELLAMLVRDAWRDLRRSALPRRRGARPQPAPDREVA